MFFKASQTPNGRLLKLTPQKETFVIERPAEKPAFRLKQKAKVWLVCFSVIIIMLSALCITNAVNINNLNNSIEQTQSSITDVNKNIQNTIKDIDVKGKRVLLRVDFNVPLDENKNITDDNRIMESLSTINYLIENGAKLVICSHLGRPKGEVNKKYSLEPVAKRLGQLVKCKVAFAEDTIGPDAKAKVKELGEGEILLLENLRFDAREEGNDSKFCKELASLADIYVNDAFGTAHRKHASTYGVAELLPNAVGFLMGKEIKVINQILILFMIPFYSCVV